MYGEIFPSFSEGIIYRTGTQTILYLTYTTISSVDLALVLKIGYLWIVVQAGMYLFH